MKSDVSESEALDMLNGQSSVAAVLGASIGAVVVAFLWKTAVLLVPGDPGVLCIPSGIIVGLFVRFIGYGISLRFRIIACSFTILGVFLGLYLVEFEVSNLFFSLWLVAGIGAAFFVATRPMSPEIAGDVWKKITLEGFRESGLGGSVPALFVVSIASSFISIVAVVVFAESVGITAYVDTVSEEERLARGEVAFEKGWNVGKFFTAQDCNAYADSHTIGCDGDRACEAETSFILAGCLEAAKQNGDMD